MPLSLQPKSITSVLVVFLVGYGLLVLLIYMFQDRLLFFPERYSKGYLEENAARLGLRLWPNSDDYQGLVSDSDSLESKGTIIVFHGNAGAALDRIYYVRELHELGYRVILFEYPGYGARGGKPNEGNLVYAATETINDAYEAFGGPLYVLGESLGCGVASALSGEDTVQIEGIILITPWDNLPSLAQRLYWYLPAKWITRDRYDNVRNLRDNKAPVAVIMAGQDNIIPNRHTQRLHELISGDKRLWEIKGGGHNTWHMVADNELWTEIMRYLSEHGVSPSPPQ